MNSETLSFDNITDLMLRLGLPAPLHPLIMLVNYDEERMSMADAGKWFDLGFYKISFKESFSGSVQYGPGQYDFKNGGLAFLAPRQTVMMSGAPEDHTGYALFFHSELLQRHSLSQTIHRYGFFAMQSLKLCSCQKRKKE
ncbi:hypothetical protein [Arcticibacter sp. MXS-1]|uniref:hypothetical protein n=1 Tax=Arcticibacter sp. MXS-1 TaxID=3341726 RepID=UPI0035A98DB4